MAKLLIPGRAIPIEVKPKDGKSFKLKELHEHIKCTTVELVRVSENCLMWIDEDGKSKPGLQRNNVATNLLHQAGVMFYDQVVGNALITTAKEAGEGEDE